MGQPFSDASLPSSIPNSLLLVLDRINDTLFTVNLKWQFSYLNNHAKNLLGGELLGQLVWNKFLIDDNEIFFQVCQRVVKEQTPLTFEGIYTPLQKPVSVSVYPIIEGLLVFCQENNQTEKVQSSFKSSSELEVIERELQNEITRNMAEGVCLMRADDGMIVYANPKFERMFGYGSGELNNQSINILKYQDETTIAQEVTAHIMAEILSKGEASYEVHNIKKDGTPFWCSATASVFEHPQYGRVLVTVKQDITERKEAEDKLRKSEELYRTLVSNFPDSAVMLFDRDLRYTLAEGVELQKAGYHKEKMEGKTIWEVLPPDTIPLLAPFYQAALNGETKKLNWKTPTRSDYFEAKVAPVKNKQGVVFAGMLMVQNVTERIKREEALKALTLQLELSNRDLQDFSSVVSHDLQEPLRKIVVFGERLRQEYGTQLNEEGQDYLTRMQKAAKRMQNLISDLLSLSQVTTKTQPFTIVNLTRIVEEVLTDLEMQIEQTGAIIALAKLTELEAEPTQMRQLLQNLISNALKFNKPGQPPRIKISGQAAGNYYQLEITDNGIGFDEKYAEQIFGAFQRLHGKSSAYEGTGVGLAICRKIVERHRGTIMATSIQGNGATFTITLPIKQQER